MKVEKSFDLLNSEGSIIKIQKIEGYWHYLFHGSRHHHITTVKEILSSIWNDDLINDPNSRKTYKLSEYPISMRDNHTAIVEYLLRSEFEKSIKDPEYFRNNYMDFNKK